MKIMRIYLKLPPFPGGMEKHIKRLTEEQVKDGNFVKVYFNAGDKISIHDERITPFLPLHTVRPQAIGVLLFYFFLSVKLLFKRDSFDIVHIHGDWSSLVFAGIVKRLTKARMVAFSIHDQIGDGVTHRKFLPFLLKKVDHLFSTGLNTARKLGRLTGKNVIFQPSGVDDAFFSSSERPDDEAFRVITVANLVPKKNIDLILDIAAIIKDVTFDIIGNGPDKKRLIDRIATNSLTNVRLLGFKPHSEVAEILKDYDCFLLTSFFEGTPTALLEAMASGLPIVSSNAGGLRDIITDYENGFIVDGFKPNVYKDHILLLRNDSELRERIFKNNRDKSLGYKWQHVSKQITDLMEKPA